MNPSWQDAFNAMVMVLGAMSVLLTVTRIFKLRSAFGSHPGTPLFFTAWGVWNMAFYASFDKPWSVCAAAFQFLVAAAWLTAVVRYGKYDVIGRGTTR